MTDGHFAKATGDPEANGAENGAQVAQNQAQQVHADNREELHESTQPSDVTTSCASLGDDG